MIFAYSREVYQLLQYGRCRFLVSWSQSSPSLPTNAPQTSWFQMTLCPGGVGWVFVYLFWSCKTSKSRCLLGCAPYWGSEVSSFRLLADISSLQLQGVRSLLPAGCQAEGWALLLEPAHISSHAFQLISPAVTSLVPLSHLFESICLPFLPHLSDQLFWLFSWLLRDHVIASGPLS